MEKGAHRRRRTSVARGIAVPRLEGVSLARAIAVVATLPALWLVGCGQEARQGVERLSVGRGAEGAVILRPAGREGPLPTVVFLHGWRVTDPDRYGPWLEHLARGGNAVIYPAYEHTFVSLPSAWLGDALDGVREALEEVEVAPGSLVVAGHSAGGALAADYAAVAPAEGLPPARAVFAIYPGRRARGFPGFIPSTDPARIPSDTRILAVVAADDRVVDDEAARALVEGAVRVPRRWRRLERIDDPDVDDHGAPLRDDPEARRAFWLRLDRLIAAARKS